MPRSPKTTPTTPARPVRGLRLAALSGLCALLLAACSQGGSPTPTPSPTPSPTGCSVGVPSSTTAARGVIVRYRDAAGVFRAQAAGAQSLGGGSAGRTVLLPTADVPGTLARLRQDPAVLYAVPNAVLRALGGPTLAQALTPVVPSDQYAYLQWAYPRLGYGAVWADMQANPYPNPVTVAVLDTGVRYDHPDLAGALIGPGDGALNLVPRCSSNVDNGPSPSPDPTDPATPNRTEGSHGTHVTGIIAARWGTFPAPCPGCSTSGVVGAAYRAPVKVLPVRVLDAPGGYGDEATIALAVRYASGETVTLSDGNSYTNPHPAQVINLSVGGPISAATAQPLCDAVAAATARGSLVVAAGGNDGTPIPYYPAACPGALAVASVAPASPTTWQRAYYSNFYAQIALSAPGGSDRTFINGQTLNGQPFPDVIYSTSWNYPDNQPNYEAEFGTSQATPQVSALAALLLSKGVVPMGTGAPAALTQRMEQTADHLGDPGRNPQFGYGVINAAAALNAPPVSP